MGTLGSLDGPADQLADAESPRAAAGSIGRVGASGAAGAAFFTGDVSALVCRRARPAGARAPVQESRLVLQLPRELPGHGHRQSDGSSLEKNGVKWSFPNSAAAACRPLTSGTLERFNEAARANVASLHPWVAQGYDVVVPVASCSLMLKREYPELMAQRSSTKQVAERTFDICEYLMRMKKDGSSRTDFRQEAWSGRLSDSLPSSRSKHRLQIQRTHGMCRRAGGGD